VSAASFTWKGEEFKRKLHEAVKRGLTDASMVLADGVVNVFGVNHGGVASKPGHPPNTQTGHARKSVGYTKADDDWRSFVGTNVPYLRYLDGGAVIRSRSGKAITIPLSAEAKRMVAAVNGRARSVINALKFDKIRPLRFFKTANGILIVRMASNRSKDRGTGEAFILLTDHATIHARPWAKPAVKRSRDAMERVFVNTAARQMAVRGGRAK